MKSEAWIKNRIEELKKERKEDQDAGAHRSVLVLGLMISELEEVLKDCICTICGEILRDNQRQVITSQDGFAHRVCAEEFGYEDKDLKEVLDD